MVSIKRQKIIMDVDTGVDDALAILLAVHSQAFDLAGITVVSGNVALEQSLLNTNKIIRWLGMQQQIPIIRGANRPLVRQPCYEHRVHGKDGLGGALADLKVGPLHQQTNAVTFLIEQVMAHKHELTLIMTAPLTNLALAVKRCPEMVDNVQRVIIMGGVFASYGNVTPTSEFNMYVDPEAAKIVLHAGLPITLVGLNVTRRVLLTEQHLQLLGSDPTGMLVRRLTDHYMDVSAKRSGKRACALHDPLAVGVALDPSIVTTHPYYVDVETDSDLCDGQTICDFQNRWGKQPNARVCTQVDSDRFLRMFIHDLKQETDI